MRINTSKPPELSFNLFFCSIFNLLFTTPIPFYRHFQDVLYLFAVPTSHPVQPPAQYTSDFIPAQRLIQKPKIAFGLLKGASHYHHRLSSAILNPSADICRRQRWRKSLYKSFQLRCDRPEVQRRSHYYSITFCKQRIYVVHTVLHRTLMSELLTYPRILCILLSAYCPDRLLSPNVPVQPILYISIGQPILYYLVLSPHS